MTKKSNKGLTLIELLVVVLIIGILAAVALPQYQKAVLKSRFVQAKTLARAIATSANLFYMENGSWPTSLNDLDIDITSTATNVQEFIASFPWGYCSLACSGQCGGCYLQKSSFGSVGYWYQPFSKNKRACVVVDNSVEAITQLCQTETHKSTGNHSSGYTMYWYD